MNHTPGPWEVEKDDEIFGRYRLVGVDAEETKWIEEGYEKDWEDEDGDKLEGDRRDAEARERDEANRLLIKAAPDLLEGCQGALAYLADPPSKFKQNREEAVRIIEAAIAKAEGRE